MRAIKFRAWDSKLSKMIYFDQFFISESKLPTPINYDFSSWETCIPMQATGVKDKNGNDIYEFDIIHRKRESASKTGETGTLRTFEEKRVVEFRFDRDDAPAGYNIGASPRNPWEVIGNVYETPELLEK